MFGTDSVHTDVGKPPFGRMQGRGSQGLADDSVAGHTEFGPLE